MIYFGSNYYHILIARFISGFAGGGMQSATILYVSEIANDEYVIEIFINFFSFRMNHSLFRLVFAGAWEVLQYLCEILEFYLFMLLVQ